MKRHLGILLFLLSICLVTELQGSAAGVVNLRVGLVSGGGGESQGGNYAVGATIGQPITGHSTGGSMDLEHGFWGVAVEERESSGNSYTVYMPIVIRP